MWFHSAALRSPSYGRAVSPDRYARDSDQQLSRSSVRSTAAGASATCIDMLARFDHPSNLNLDRDGAELFAQALAEPALVRLEAALAALSIDTPGVRIGEGPLL